MAANFHPGQVTNADVAAMLRLSGTLKPTPVAVLQDAERIVQSLVTRYTRPLSEYKRVLDGVSGRLPGLLRAGMSDEDVADVVEQLQGEINRTPPPIPDGTVGPDFFRGFHCELVDSGVRYVNKKPESGMGLLPSISLDNVYDAAHLMVKQLNTIIALPGTIPWPGIDTYEAGPWDKLDDHLRSDVCDTIGMDGKPGAYHDFVWSYAYNWGLLLQSVAQWLYLTCESKD